MSKCVLFGNYQRQLLVSGYNCTKDNSKYASFIVKIIYDMMTIREEVFDMLNDSIYQEFRYIKKNNIIELN